jgi:hypothetical protein
MPKSRYTKSRYAKKPICQKADRQKADMTKSRSCEPKAYIKVHLVLKAASAECSAGSNDHFVVVGGADFQY